MKLFTALGVDIQLLIAHLINFLILVGLLYKFGYKPILKFVKERQDKIEQGLTDAEAAQKRLEEAGKKKEALVAQAHKEAQEVIGKAKEHAQQQANAMLAKTKDEARAIVERAKKEIRLEQEQSIAHVREQAAELVLSATEKVLKEKMDAHKDEQFIKGIIASS